MPVHRELKKAHAWESGSGVGTCLCSGQLGPQKAFRPGLQGSFGSEPGPLSSSLML